MASFSSYIGQRNAAAPTLTVSTIQLASTVVTLGASTTQTYPGATKGSYTTGWASTLTGLTSTIKVSETANGTNILALRANTSAISTSVNSGLTWSTIAGAGLPTDTPVSYTHLTLPTIYSV